jgi:tRNA (guanine-N7-)-methyltransferase
LDLVATHETDRALDFLGRWDRVEIEIGSGNGHFLTEYGARLGQCGLLGIESKPKRCGKIEKKIELKKLANILIFNGKAEALLARLADGSLDAFHVYFPDPWPKTKHRRRRLFKMDALEVFYRALKPGGRIYFATDVHDYYLQVKILGLLHGGFAVRDGDLPPETALSSFNLKTRRAGKTLRGLVLEKTAGAITVSGCSSAGAGSQIST